MTTVAPPPELSASSPDLEEFLSVKGSEPFLLLSPSLGPRLHFWKAHLF
jgi:hypothetical protein